MKRVLLGILIIFLAGCHTDIVTTKQLRAVKNKCIYVQPIESQDPYVGKVLRDVLEKEFIRKSVRLCDSNTATIILTGSTFLTTRSSGSKGLLGVGGKESSAQSIESLTISGKDQQGNILLNASYDNAEQFTASKLAQEFGSALADKLK
jgi:RecA-family ATPase